MTDFVHPTLQTNVDFFENRFTEGYGIKYPESHVIRFNLHVLKHKCGISSGRILDFGCALGTHSSYFAEHGFDVVACDSSASAIERAKSSHPELSDSFYVNDPMPDFAETTGKFDVIFCNQVLPYFTDDALRILTDRFYKMTKPGGVFFATMYPTTNGITEYVTGHDNEMSEITLHGRLSGREWVNFKTTEQMVEDFLPYKKLYTGFTGMQLDDEYGNNDQIIFIGVKE